MMKKILFPLAFAALGTLFASCETTDPVVPQPEGKELQQQPHYTLAQHYFVVKATDAANAQVLQGRAEELVIKLGEDGKAWIFSKGQKIHPEAKPCQAPHGHETPPTIEGGKASWFVYATTYRGVDSHAYLIEGFGKITVNPAENTAQVQLNTPEQPTVSLQAQSQKSPIETNETTAQLARSWKLLQTKIEATGGSLTQTFGKIFQDEMAGNLVAIAQDLDQITSQQHHEMLDYLQAHQRATNIREITLSATGILAIYYENGQHDIAHIKNFASDATGQLDWLSEEMSNKYLTGNKGISYQLRGQLLLLTLKSDVNTPQQNTPYSVKVELLLEAAQ